MPTTPSQSELNAADGYEALFVPGLFTPWVKHVINAAQITEGMRVVDVACGTGVLARHVLEVVGPDGEVTGVDPASGMLAAAATRQPSVTWKQGVAEALPLELDAADTIVSQFGLMFFQDIEKALAEFTRVLVPQGTLTVAVWDNIEHNPAYEVVTRLLDKEIGTHAGDALRLPYRLGDATEVAAQISRAGFKSVVTHTIEEIGRFPNAHAMVEAELRGWLPMFDIQLDEPVIQAILAKAPDYLAEYVQSDGAVAFPMSAHIISATNGVNS